jgi:hypothetical protein
MEAAVSEWRRCSDDHLHRSEAIRPPRRAWPAGEEEGREVNRSYKMADDIESREAKHGEKMIEIKLRFWTDDIAPEVGKVKPKHAWTGGVVRMEANKSHGISTTKPVVFNSLLDVGSVIEDVLIRHGVVLHPSRKMRKYLKDKA